ncbi:MAG TPA: class I SAM-dependent methyltransferase [Ilumatobacter sp.]|nr:class I SAM-dependent methyltransferase [Ilumatobacter sp.]
MNASTAWNAVADIEGWMTRGQSDQLFEAAAGCPADGQIVEIGSFQGRSTVVLALGAPDGARVIAIDPHAGNDRGPQEISGYAEAASADHDAFNANLASAGIAERVTHVRDFSDKALQAVSGDIDVLYIDGAHRYGPARADIAAWGDRVAPGGTMLIHDSFSSIGVTLAILRELAFGSKFRYVGRSRSQTVYRADLSDGRVANAFRQLAQLPWFVKNVLLKVGLTLGLGKALRRFGRQVPDWPY